MTRTNNCEYSRIVCGHPARRPNLFEMKSKAKISMEIKDKLDELLSSYIRNLLIFFCRLLIKVVIIITIHRPFTKSKMSRSLYRPKAKTDNRGIVDLHL